MRFLLLLAAVAIIGATFWALGPGPSPADPVAAGEGRGTTQVTQSSPELMEPDQRLSRVTGTVSGDKVAGPTPGAGVPWPEGFGRVDLLVVHDGVPVEGAVVTVNPEVEPRFDAVLEADEEATTDSRGRISFYARPTRTFSLVAREPSLGWVVESVQTTPFAGRAREVKVEFPLTERDGLLQAIVVSERTGLPLAGVRVGIGEPGQQSASHAVTDEQGRAGVPSTEGQELLFVLAGYGAKKVTIGPDQGGMLRVALRPFATLYGKSGAPIGPEARSRLKPRITAVPRYGDEEERIEAGWVFTSSKDSQVVQTAGDSLMLFYGRQYSADVKGDGTWRIEEIQVREGEHVIPELEVCLQRGGVKRRLALLRGVAPGDSIEIHDPWIHARPWAVQVLYGDDSPPGPGTHLSLEYTGSSPATLDLERMQDGRFQIPAAPTGLWNYSITSAGHPPNTPMAGQVRNEGGESVVRLEGRRRITGKILAEAGLAGTSLSVTLIPAGDPAEVVLSSPFDAEQFRRLVGVDAKGAFQIECVPVKGRWEVAVLDYVDDLHEIGRGIVPVDQDSMTIHVSPPKLPSSDGPEGASSGMERLDGRVRIFKRNRDDDR